MAFGTAMMLGFAGSPQPTVLQFYSSTINFKKSVSIGISISMLGQNKAIIALKIYGTIIIGFLSILMVSIDILP